MQNWWVYWPLWSVSTIAHFLREQAFKLDDFPVIDCRRGSPAYSYGVSFYSKHVFPFQPLTWLWRKIWTCFNSCWAVRATVSGYTASNPRRTHHPGCWVLLDAHSYLPLVLTPVTGSVLWSLSTSCLRDLPGCNTCLSGHTDLWKC